MPNASTRRTTKARQARQKRLTALTKDEVLSPVEKIKLSKLTNEAAKIMTYERIAELGGHSKGWWNWVAKKQWKQVRPTILDLAQLESVMLVHRAGKRKSERKIMATRNVLQLAAMLRKAAYELIAEEMR